MKTQEIKKILFEKLHDEGCYFTMNHISVTKSKFTFSTSWNDNTDEWNYDTIPAIKIVIKDYESIHFFITEMDNGLFGTSLDVWKKNYCTSKQEYYKESHLIYDGGGVTDEYYKEAILSLGYYIGTRF